MADGRQPSYDSLPEGAKASIAARLDVQTAAQAARASSEFHKLCQEPLWRRICCAACGHPVVHPRDVLGKAPKMRLQDGEGMCVQNASGVSLAQEYTTTDHDIRYQWYQRYGVKSAVNSSFWTRLQPAMCGSCGLYLGCTVVSVQQGHGAGGDDEDDDGAAPSDSMVGRTYLSEKYVRLLKQDGSGARGETGGGDDAFDVPLRCRGPPGSQMCDSQIGRQGDILSLRHHWDAGRGPEPATLLNSATPGSLYLKNCRIEQLAQGRMEVEDAFCSKCHTQVGWRFLRNLQEDQAHVHDCIRYVGRYGIVSSSLSIT